MRFSPTACTMFQDCHSCHLGACVSVKHALIIECALHRESYSVLYTKKQHIARERWCVPEKRVNISHMMASGKGGRAKSPLRFSAAHSSPEQHTWCTVTASTTSNRHSDVE